MLKLRLPLGLLAAAALIAFADPAWFLPALIVSAVGELGQLWCFGALKTQKTLASQGPYALMRNPMYAARFLLILGVVLLPGRLWLIPPYAVLYYFYMVNRVKREEAKLREIFGAEYEQYCREVNRYLPTLRRREGRSLWFFRRENFSRNHGPVNALALAAVYAAAYLYLLVWK
jgi:protein-S-isoprenylcysteine O-methyltransferase Ste14